VKWVQVANPNSTLSIGAFATLIWHGDQNLQTGPKVDSNKRIEGHREELVWNNVYIL
jgi:hypothetical protein